MGMSLQRLGADRRSSVVLMFAVILPAIIFVTGLAIDFAFWYQSYAAVQLAASGAALQAVKVAASGEVAQDPYFVTEGQTAGSQWFQVMVGTLASSVTSITPVVTVSPGTSITAKVTLSTTASSTFGKMFGISSYPLTVEADAVVGVVPNTDLTLLIDNSPSMLIGASPSDIATLLLITPCTPTTAYYPTASGQYNPPANGESMYRVYQCDYGSAYDGTLSCPVAAQAPFTFSTFTPNNITDASPGPSCQGYLSKQSPSGLYPLAGSPCAFACHYDTSKPAGTGNDMFATARSTIGTSNPVTLRFDVVKAAARGAVTDMQSVDGGEGKIAANIFTFDTTAHPLYPSDGSYSSNWVAALDAIGSQATTPNTADTGLQPPGGYDTPSTDFTETMSALIGTYLTAGGSGATAASPRKALILITDGMQNSTSHGANVAFDPTPCTTLKNMGYTIFVLYTIYNPLMNYFYLQFDAGVAEGTGTGTISTNLSECASSSADFIVATDAATVSSGLKTLLGYALTSQARLTK
jgi:Flp pilus assembly protein TadG